VTLATKKRKTWTCPKCKRKNEVRTSSRTCQYGCGATKPKKRETKAKPTDSYEVYAILSAAIHGGDTGACGCCGRPKADHNYDREHDHRTGNARGLACYRCNNVLLRNHTLATLRMCVAYLERVDAYYAQ
jgi:hypothetical protein